MVLAETCRGPEETGLMLVIVAVTVDDPFEIGFDEVDAHESEEEGVSNSGGGDYTRSVSSSSFSWS